MNRDPDRWFNLTFVFAALLGFVMWGGIIFVAHHFITKWW